jgi:hypothetical protein
MDLVHSFSAMEWLVPSFDLAFRLTIPLLLAWGLWQLLKSKPPQPSGTHMNVLAGTCAYHPKVQLCKITFMAEWRAYADECPECVAEGSVGDKGGSDGSGRRRPIVMPERAKPWGFFAEVPGGVPANAIMDLHTGACVYHPNFQWCVKNFGMSPPPLWGWKCSGRTCPGCAAESKK